MSRGAIAYVDLCALKNNFSRIKTVASGCSILAMIKSNAYGHGLSRVATALSEADAFGVASLEEAVILRTAGIQQSIMVMAGFYSEEELPQFVHYDLTAIVHRSDQVSILEKKTIKKPLSVWLKIDTGMHRLGFSIKEALAMYARLQACTFVRQPMVILTHLADADNPKRQFTETQIANFNHITAHLSNPKSIVNSAGLLSYRDALADWVRPGIVLYGVSPFLDRVGEQEGLQPVMTLTAKIIAKKQVKKGDCVGYGCTWVCPEDMPMGIVGIGYGDGYPRHAKNGTPTLVNGKRCPLVGRVSMDMIAIDLRECSMAAVGDRVVLWGKGLPVEKIAECADTIGYELLCHVTSRVEFIEKSVLPEMQYSDAKKKLSHEVRSSELNRIRWHCTRRGMLELDTLLGNFFDHHFLQLSDHEQQLFVALLEQPDPVLYDWLLGHSDPDDAEVLALIKKIR